MLHVVMHTSFFVKKMKVYSLCTDKLCKRHFCLVRLLYCRHITLTYYKILWSNVYIESNLFGNFGIRKGD